MAQPALNATFNWLAPISIFTIALLVGIIIDRIFQIRLAKIAARTKWEGDDIIIKAFKGMFTLWFSMIGIYNALPFLPLKSNLITIIHKILVVLIISTVSLVLARIASGIIQLKIQKAESRQSTSILVNITKGVIYGVGFLVILQSLGISITPILTALGVGGLAVALALQDTLSNLFAGLQILLTRQIRPGDYIRLNTGEEGYITDITWRNTTIHQLPNNVVIIPNAKLANSIVINHNLPNPDLSIIIPVQVSYDSDLDKVERITLEVAKEIMQSVPGGVPDFQPLIRYHSFGDSGIQFNVIIRAQEYSAQFPVRHEFIKRLHKRYLDEGIRIPYPTRTIYTGEK